MADSMNDTLGSAQNATSKPEVTTQGMLIAYVSLILMALLPIFFGAFRSVKFLKKQKATGEKPEIMSKRDAAMFPIIASCALFGLYIFFMVFSKEYINLLLTIYFFGLGVLALAHSLSPFVSSFVPKSFQMQHHILYTRGFEEKEKEVIIDFTCTTGDIISLALCSLIGAVYLWNKHWVVNNIFGLAFALNGVEFLQLNTIIIGCMLLGGLFFYDIFWVFATDVMVTVAKSFEAPIKLVFPQDIMVNWLGSSNFAMLGLGDIVIPGMFIALLLRFDESLKRGQKLYFYSSFIAYFLGLVLTIYVLTVFKHAQPALLYLVPACIGVPGLVAFIKGDIKELLNYADHPEAEQSPVSSKESTPDQSESSSTSNESELKKKK